MLNFLARSSIAILLAHSLFIPTTIFAQRSVRVDGRVIPSRVSPAKAHDEWKTIAATPITSLDRIQEPATTGPEPTIRVALLRMFAPRPSPPAAY